MTLALINGRILTDAGFVDDRLVLVEEGRIIIQPSTPG